MKIRAVPTYCDYGIVLSEYNLAEQDRVLNIYTKGNGLVRAVGKGVRKPNSRYGSKVDQLSCCFFQFAQGKNLDIVSECEQVNKFPLLRNDLPRLTCALLYLEIVSGFAHEMDSESTKVYDLLYSVLDELQRAENPLLHSIRFIVEFLSLHGYKPQLKTCVHCSKQVNKKPESYSYSAALGGVLCVECAGIIDSKQVSHKVLKVIESYSDYSREHEKIDQELLYQVLELLREHIDMRSKKKIKSFELLFSL